MVPPSLVLHNGPVIERVVDGLFAFYSLLGEASEGAHNIQRDGLLACVVPVAPERAVANGVVYRSADALGAAGSAPDGPCGRGPRTRLRPASWSGAATCSTRSPRR